jgi:hypothetical protein
MQKGSVFVLPANTRLHIEAGRPFTLIHTRAEVDTNSYPPFHPRPYKAHPSPSSSLCIAGPDGLYLASAHANLSL